jgi:hypothetical protein
MGVSYQMSGASHSSETRSNALPKNVFLETLREMRALAEDEEEDFRLRLVEQANRIIETRLNSGEAVRSDYNMQLLLVVDTLLGRKTKNGGRFPRVFENSQERDIRLGKSYDESRSTIAAMHSVELFDLIRKLRREMQLSEVLSSLSRRTPPKYVWVKKPGKSPTDKS